MFDDTQIEKYKFHQHNSSISKNNTDINKIVVSNKVPFGKKDFKIFYWLQRYYKNDCI